MPTKSPLTIEPIRQAKRNIDLEPIRLAPETCETSRQEGLPLVDVPAFRVDLKAPRIFCAFCENTQPEQLHYFYAKEEKDLCVDMCDHGQNNLKTVDGREASRPVLPTLEQVASLHLYIIAADKGFTGGVNLNLER